MKRKLSPPPDKQNTPGILYRNTNTTGEKIKASTRMILVHVQKMYKTYIYIGVPDHSSSSFFAFFSKNAKRKLSPPEEKKIRNMYRRCTIYLEYYYSERECKGAGTCPCMEINVSVQYNGGLLPDTMLSTRCVFFKK